MVAWMMQAQKLNGDVSCLKGQKTINVVFVFDPALTYDGDTETEFFAEKAPGQDNPDQWKADWTGKFRTEMWPAEFIEGFNEEAEKKPGMNAVLDQSAEYTATVTITDIDPGNFAGPMSNPTKLDGKITIAKKGSDEIFATIPFENIPGNPYIMTPVHEKRVAAAFNTIGEMLGKIFAKKVK